MRTRSPPRSCRSRGSWPAGRPTRRSRRSCSSAPDRRPPSPQRVRQAGHHLPRAAARPRPRRIAAGRCWYFGCDREPGRSLPAPGRGLPPRRALRRDGRRLAGTSSLLAVMSTAAAIAAEQEHRAPEERHLVAVDQRARRIRWGSAACAGSAGRRSRPRRRRCSAAPCRASHRSAGRCSAPRWRRRRRGARPRPARCSTRDEHAGQADAHEQLGRQDVGVNDVSAPIRVTSSMPRTASGARGPSRASDRTGAAACGDTRRP